MFMRSPYRNRQSPGLSEGEAYRDPGLAFDRLAVAARRLERGR
jgi:hypothetical protein